MGVRATAAPPNEGSGRPATARPATNGAGENSGLTNPWVHPYPGCVTHTSRSFYFYGSFYYGYPLAGRDWRRTRE